MVTDPRVKIILDHVIAAAREVKPSAPAFSPDAEDLEIMAIAIKVFDRLLPMVMTIILAEYHRQKGGKPDAVV